MRKSLFGKESNYIDWLWNERYQISITLFAALLPIVATLFIKIWEGEFRNGGYITIFHNFFAPPFFSLYLISHFPGCFARIIFAASSAKCFLRNDGNIVNSAIV